MSRLDQLFKNKLADHSREPSQDAWSRVKAGQSKKNNGIIWFRWAAGLLVAGILVGTIYWLTSRPTPASVQPIAAQESTKVDTLAKRRQDAPRPTRAEQKTQTTSKHAPLNTPMDSARQIIPVVVEEKQVAEVTPVDQLIPTKENAIETNAARVPQEKTIVLEYRLDRVPTQAPSEPSLASKEKSGLQKVIELAREAKNGESSISLRQAKDEIFALNFKKDKKDSK